MRRFSLLALLALATALPAADPAPTFPLKDGDIWVMAGDSITAQHLHSNYFEAFCYARYPKLTFAFRNSGVGGHTIPTTLARFDYDIAAWKPTVVSVELGMNDQGGTNTEQFIKNMGTMTTRIRDAKARPVILSASPINNGDLMSKLSGPNGNKRLSEYALAIKEFSAKEEIPYADQFHALVDVWGNNKPRENLANSLGTIRALSTDEGLAGAEHLKAFLAEQLKTPTKAVSMQGDAVHPGPNGQLMMAAALLKRLGAEGFVSSATITAEKPTDVKGCEISMVKVTDKMISFDRLDECLPFPIPNDARAVLTMAPEVLALSQYTLKVTGLKTGDYSLAIEGVPYAKFTAKELAEGINLTSIGNDPMVKTPNPIVAQMQAVLGAVSFKEGIVGAWRNLSQKAHAKGADAKLMDELAALTKKVEAADVKIREAAKPKKMHFDIEAVK